MATSNGRGIGRILEKLEKSVKDGNYYEAHQMYRTLYFRYLGQSKYAELLDMLYSGAILFLDHKQFISGADLGILLIDVLVKSENRNFTEWTPKLSKIFAKISQATPERDTFLSNAIRWSSGDGIHGHPYLHQRKPVTYVHDMCLSFIDHLRSVTSECYKIMSSIIGN